MYARDFAPFACISSDPSSDMASLVGHQLDLPGSGARLLDSICEIAWRIYLPSQIIQKHEYGS